MDPSPTETQCIAARLNDLLAEAGQPALSGQVAEQFAAYCALLMRWNARTNLTAIRDEEGILRRHFVESIACARALPAGIGSLLDFGSGAGFPGLPIALCRPEISVMLAESQNKKAAFLREAVRTLDLGAAVHSGRAESLSQTFDCVTLRAVDRMERGIQVAVGLVRGGGCLAVLTTAADVALTRAAADSDFAWAEPVFLIPGTERVLLVGHLAG